MEDIRRDSPSLDMTLSILHLSIIKLCLDPSCFFCSIIKKGRISSHSLPCMRECHQRPYATLVLVKSLHFIICCILPVCLCMYSLFSVFKWFSELG